jgi:hypothetical protein
VFSTIGDSFPDGSRFAASAGNKTAQVPSAWAAVTGMLQPPEFFGLSAQIANAWRGIIVIDHG